MIGVHILAFSDVDFVAILNQALEELEEGVHVSELSRDVKHLGLECFLVVNLELVDPE